MEVKPGYKQTEVGVIPEEWACEKLAGFFSFISYGFTNPMPTVHDGIFMITAADINEGRLQLETARKTSETAYRKLLTAKSKPRKNDILLTKDGTLGRLALVGDETVCINQSVAVIRPNERVEPTFLKLLLESPRYQKRMVEDAGGSTIKHIYITIVDKMPLGLPLDREEQRAIAEALSDVDGLLGGLDRLIAKKRDLKQAAMQQLLTGQTRLPGFGSISTSWQHSTFGEFPSDWRLQPLSQVSAFITKGSTPTTYGFEWVSSGVLFLRSECVSERGLELSQSMFVSPKAHQLLRRSEVRSGDILMTITGNVGRVVHLGREFQASNINQHIARIRITDDQVASAFVFHFLSQPLVRKYYNQITTGQAYPQISLTQVRNTVLPMPSLPEQTAIATVLSEMDGELAVLEQRREKTRALKQAMMQELLTGRTRLV